MASAKNAFDNTAATIEERSDHTENEVDSWDREEHTRL